MIDRLRARLRHQFVRFGLSGAMVAAAHVVLTTVLLVATGLPDQAALAIAYAAAVLLHFTLNRQFVFPAISGYRHGLPTQTMRYGLLVVTTYGATALSVAVLPGAIGAPSVAVYVVTAIVLALLNFAVLRRWVFASVGAPRSVVSDG
jgi:putative flippase GtrA